MGQARSWFGTANEETVTWPLAGSHRERESERTRELDEKGFGGQASKGIRWMPWHQEAMKDVVKLRKATGSRKQASIRRSPNRETVMDEVHEIQG